MWLGIRLVDEERGAEQARVVAKRRGHDADVSVDRERVGFDRPPHRIQEGRPDSAYASPDHDNLGIDDVEQVADPEAERVTCLLDELARQAVIACRGGSDSAGIQAGSQLGELGSPARGNSFVRAVYEI